MKRRLYISLASLLALLVSLPCWAARIGEPAPDFTAKDTFGRDQVAKGKKVLITRRGKPASLLGPPPQKERRDVRQLVKEMLAFRDGEGPMLGDQVTIRELIDEGRCF